MPTIRDIRRSLGLARTWTLAFVLASIGACASSGPSGGGVMDKALDLVGLQSKPAMPDLSAADVSKATKIARNVTLRIHAGEALNTDTQGRSLSLVMRIYKLKDVEAFLQLPSDGFKESVGGKSADISGVVEVREIVLTPGKKYEVVESVPAGASHLAIVGLFRAPDEKRWRFAFDVRAAANSEITLGAHGCALSVSEGQPVMAAPDTLRLAGVRCR